MKTLSAAIGCMILLCFGTVASAHKSSPDDGYYSFYEVLGDGSLELTICTRGGCDFGFFDTFEQPCAVIETVPKIKGGVMTRDIFALDKRNSASDPMTLSIYRRTDTSVVGGGDDYEVTFTKKISLDITGGPAANCKMALNQKYLFLGTDLSAHAVGVDLKKFKTDDFGGGPVTLLSADSRGYITMSTSGNGFFLFDPEGSPVLSGGGSPYEAGDQVSTAMVVPPFSPATRFRQGSSSAQPLSLLAPAPQ